MKSEVGKSKPSTYDLPSQDFAFGKGYIKDKEGAKEGLLKIIKIFRIILINIYLVSMTWNFHQSTREPIQQVDFKKKNKEKLIKKTKVSESLCPLGIN